ncbi:MAG: DNA primase, partial [Shewanella sp.]
MRQVKTLFHNDLISLSGSRLCLGPTIRQVVPDSFLKESHIIVVRCISAFCISTSGKATTQQPNMINEQTIEKIKRHTDIVAVITPFVKLTKKGTSFRGLCPFHEERNPSFSVSPAKGIYKCFSCGETGDAIGFLMRHEAMSFGEALRWLAAKAGIEIEEQEWDPQERQRHEARECFFLLNEMAAQHFSAQLHRPEAQRFLTLRDIDAATAERFALGFASPSEDGLKRMLTRKGYPEQLLLDNGLLCVNPSKGAIDRFRNRLIFPIRNVTGRVVAFGGRLLENHDYLSKYHNSPETPFYSKGRELYGLFEGKKAIAQEENC